VEKRIDECDDQSVLDLLSQRGVILELSTNWQQLKQLLREKGLLRDNQSVVQAVDNLQGSIPPAVSTENAPQLVVNLRGRAPPIVSAEAGIQSRDDLQESTLPINVAESTKAVPTEEGFIGQARPTDATGHDETIESSTEPNVRRSFIGPMIPGGDAVNSDVELSVEQGPGAVEFIGPVIPSGAAKSTTPNQTTVYVEDEGTETVVEQNGNGSTETSESATVQSSGLQMS
jgi:hypothetical protein